MDVHTQYYLKSITLLQFNNLFNFQPVATQKEDLNVKNTLNTIPADGNQNGKTL